MSSSTLGWPIPSLFGRLFAVLLLLLSPAGGWAQEAAPAGGGGAPIWRLGFFEFTQQTYSTEEAHPFYQMTGNSRFKGGRGPVALNTLDNWKLLIDDDGHSELEGPITGILHSLPPFSLEYIAPTGFLPSYSLGFNYTNLWLTEQRAKTPTTGADPSYSTPMVRVRSHFYMFTASLYPLGPPQPGGVDFFIGTGFAFVDSTMRTGYYAMPPGYNGGSGIYVSSKSRLDASSGQLGYSRVGLASSGENLGFMLEFFFLGKGEVLGNPFQSSNLMDAADFNTVYNDRGGSLPSRASMQGALLRASWTYTFY